MVLWMVFQMSVRYTDSGGDTGGSSDRKEKNLFHSDYYRKAVMDGFLSREGVPAEREDNLHRKEPVRGAGNTTGSMRAGAERKREACIRRAPSFKVQHHGALFPDTFFGMPPQCMEHEASGTGKGVCKRDCIFF